MNFYLGTHMAHWLEHTDVPLFVSHRRLTRFRTRLPRPLGRWALDSGGFTELSTHGAWMTSPAEYVDAVRRYVDEMPGLDWAAPQDWMCEPWIVAKTGLSVAEHQQRTTDNFLLLRDLAPEVPFVPVLQGWKPSDYHDHVEIYTAAGVDLVAEPVVGVGSVCRRQNGAEAARIIHSLAGRGLSLHGFGFKLTGLRLCAGSLVSADSMAWSFNARKNPPMPGHTHRSCANCLPFALRWRESVMSVRPVEQQLEWVLDG